MRHFCSGSSTTGHTLARPAAQFDADVAKVVDDPEQKCIIVLTNVKVTACVNAQL